MRPSYQRITSYDPATLEPIGSAEATASAGVSAVAADVAEVQPFWSQLPRSDRARYMRRTAQVVIDQLDEIAALVTREQGKPLSESYTTELLASIDALHRIAAAGERALADERVPPGRPLLLRRRSELLYDPLGVVAVICSSDYPWSTPLVQVATALMCGNGVVLKPSPRAPLTGRRIQQVFERAGLPQGIVRVVQGGAEVGAALVEAPVAKVFFSGSERVGRAVAGTAGAQLKRASLLLGGKDPQLVLADAPLDHAVAACLWAAFSNAGQAPSRIERVYAVRGVARDFARRVVEGARALRVGDPRRWETEIGPLASERRLEHVNGLVDEAVAAGARLECGGPLDGHAGNFYAPAVLTGVRPDMRVMRERIRGPVVAIVEVEDEEQAVREANDSAFASGASVWTLDCERGRRIARRLDAGSVWLNDHMCPFGTGSWAASGRSGIGVTHSRFAFYECVEVKRVAWDPSRTRGFWWFPYDASLGQAVHSAAQLVYGRDADKRDALRRGAAPIGRVARRALGL